ncbi:MAG: DinB family protein [Pyrinomonadaceae bacterium]
MKRYKIQLLVLALLCLDSSATAQQSGATTTRTTTAAPQTSAQQTSAPASGFRAEFIRQHNDIAKKYVDLAEATPQEKFGWRPGEGVRSISEVYMHVAASNFAILQAVGAKPPAGMDLRGLEKITDKAKVVETLRQSVEAVRQAATVMTDADLDKPAKLFGRDTTARDVFLLLATHMHEHMGQQIAYARMNNIVPPWTVARQAQGQTRREQ